MASDNGNTLIANSKTTKQKLKKSINFLFRKIYGKHISENAKRRFVSVIIKRRGSCRVDIFSFCLMLVGEGGSLTHQQRWWMLFACLFEYHFCWKILGLNLFLQVPLVVKWCLGNQLQRNQGFRAPYNLKKNRPRKNSWTSSCIIFYLAIAPIPCEDYETR